MQSEVRDSEADHGHVHDGTSAHPGAGCPQLQDHRHHQVDHDH